MRSRAGLKRFGVVATQLILLASFLVLWEWGARSKVIDTFFYSSPSMIWTFIVKWAAQGYMWTDIWTTMFETIVALVIAAVGGVVLGVLLASNRFFGAVFEPVLVLLNAMPRIVLTPLFFLWFGLSYWSKIASGIALALFVVFFATYQGIKDVDPTLIASARVLGANRWGVIREVLVPSALSWIFSSMRSAVGFALIGAVVAEYLGASAGVGYRISYSEQSLNTSGVFGGLAVLLVLVYFIDIGIRRMQRALMPWRDQGL
jgi:NitT/TauT family transport system permease protein